MLRYSDWPERLTMFLAKRDTTPLEWGKSDCCLFSGDAIQAMTGADPAHFFRGKYKSLKEAYKLLQKFAGGGIEQTCKKIAMDMGYKQISIRQVGAGDLVLLDVENVHPDAKGLTMAVMASDTIAVAQGKDALVYIEAPDLRYAWHI